MRPGVSVLTGVFREVVAITGTSRHAVIDNSIWVTARLGQESTRSDDGPPWGLDRANDKTYRVNVLRDQLSVADGVDRRAISHHPIEVEHRFLE